MGGEGSERPGGLAAAILESAPDSVMVIDAAGMVVALNPAAEETFGYSASMALGRDLAGLVVAPRMRQRVRGALRRLARPASHSLLGRRVELVGMRADGGELEVEMTLSALRTEPPLFGAFMRDVTELHRNAEANELLAAASAAFDASLEVDQTMRTIAQTAIPKIAEVCTIDLVGDDGTIATSVAAATDQAIARRLEELRRSSPLVLSGAHPVARAIQLGEPVVIHDLSNPEADGQAVHADEHMRLMHSEGLRSVVVMTLSARGRLLGALSFGHVTESPFERNHLALMQDLADRAAMALDNAGLYAERVRVAQTLQRSLLPEVLPQMDGIALASAYHPVGAGNEVGGDFYDAFQIGSGCWLIVGDVCGKGPEAAAITALVRHSVRALAFTEEDPGRVLRAVNRVMLSHELYGRFATAVLARIDLSGGRQAVTIASAGHPPPVILDPRRGAFCPQVGGVLLGVIDEIEPESQRVALGRGAMVLLYTDGLLEAGAPRRGLSPEQLCELLEREHPSSPAAAVDSLDRLARAQGAGTLRDDIAILAALVDSP